jgi:hypothetical protein
VSLHQPSGGGSGASVADGAGRRTGTVRPTWCSSLRIAIEIERRGGGMKIIAAIENAEPIEKILRRDNSEFAAAQSALGRPPVLRLYPIGGLFFLSPSNSCAIPGSRAIPPYKLKPRSSQSRNASSHANIGIVPALAAQ